MARAEWIDGLRQDVRYALRQLRRAPAFTAVAALTLALGIGSTAAIFSAVNAVVLRPLPFRDPERLVRVWSVREGTDDFESATAANALAFREQARSFGALAPIEYRNITFTRGDRPAEQVSGQRVSADYFRVLGVAPRVGRVFTAEEDQPGYDNVVVLSHRMWTERLNGDAAIVGRTIRLNSVEHTVIGIMPPSFDVTRDGSELWVPIAFTPEQKADARKGYLELIARLAPAVSIEQAQQEMATLVKRLNEQSEERRTGGVRVVSYVSDFVGQYRTRLFTLLGAVGFVLLIACANVANLLLARGAGRGKEIAIRSALGAGRGRVIRQLFTESLMLGLIGGVAGLLLAYWGVKFLRATSPDGVPRLEQATIDLPTLAFTLLVTLGSALIFGIVPALRSARGDLQGALREGGRGSAGAVRDRVRQTLLVAEVALSLVLLVGAGLLIRSAILLQRVEVGFDAERLFTAWMSLPPSEYQSVEQIARGYDRVLEEVRAIPGIESAAAVSLVPMTGTRASGAFIPEGRADDPSNSILFNFRLATPGVFRTLRVPIREGRDFSDRDVAGAPCVLVVNQAGARAGWPNESAIGKRIPGPRDRTGARSSCTVVGVVGDVHEDGLREAVRPQLYFAAAQAPPVLWDAMQRSMFVVARTTGSPLAYTRTIQEAVMRVDRNLPLFSIRSMEQRIAESLATARFNTLLLGVLGAIGLMLAAVGIYGVVAYFVSQRTQEIGLRMALGATPRHVLRHVVGQGMRPVLLGIVLGAVASAGATKLLANLVYGVGTMDPATFVAVALTLAAVACLASVIPARRATRVQPTEALQA